MSADGQLLGVASRQLWRLLQLYHLRPPRVYSPGLDLRGQAPPERYPNHGGRQVGRPLVLHVVASELGCLHTCSHVGKCSVVQPLPWGGGEGEEGGGGGGGRSKFQWIPVETSKDFQLVSTGLNWSQLV